MTTWVSFPTEIRTHKLLHRVSLREGETKTVDVDLALVVQSANLAKAFIANRQWTLLWRDADLLYQSPRPMTVYENTYVLEPNVQRFTVAKVCNAVVPQLYKGLFYDDPPMLLRPRPGTSQKVVDAKTAIFSFVMDECKFKTQTKWGLEQMAHLGTSIFKWGYDWKEIITYKRKATTTSISHGDSATVGALTVLPTDEPPSITQDKRSIPVPFFEWRPLDKVLVDPQLWVSDIRMAGWVVDVRYMDWYQLDDLCKAIQGALDAGEDGAAIKGWKLPTLEERNAIWANPPKAQTLETEQATYIEGVVHHAERNNVKASPDPHRVKLEVLEYWDAGRKILVLNQEKVIFCGDNEFQKFRFCPRTGGIVHAHFTAWVSDSSSDRTSASIKAPSTPSSRF